MRTSYNIIDNFCNYYLFIELGLSSEKESTMTDLLILLSCSKLESNIFLDLS